MQRLTMMAMVLVALASAPALAATYDQTLISLLQKQGYSDVTASRTMLGRTRVVAIGSDHMREIILDPNTGEILRDLSKRLLATAESGGDGRNGDSSAVASSGAVSSGAVGTATMTETIDAPGDATMVAPEYESDLLPTLRVDD